MVSSRLLPPVVPANSVEEVAEVRPVLERGSTLPFAAAPISEPCTGSELGWTASNDRAAEPCSSRGERRSRDEDEGEAGVIC